MAARLRVNFAANAVGRVVTALVAILFVPVYIRFLGLEAYGLVGFYANLLALLNVFDFGLSATMNREMARSIAAGTKSDAGDFARTLEFGYLGIGIAVGATLLSLSPWISAHWFRAERLSPSEIRNAVALMGVVFASQWPLSLHIGGLMGLERQIWGNSISSSFALLQALGAVAVLKFVSPTVTAFFAWQALVACLQSIVAWRVFWLAFAPERTPSVRWTSLLPARTFAASMSGAAVMVVFLGQFDKLILSKFVPLSQFAGYALASTVASAIALPAAPVSDALFPRYVRLSGRDHADEFASLFHLSNQAVAALAFSAAGVAVFFSRSLIYAWTGRAALAAEIEGLVALLAFGAAINCAMSMLDLLQMAQGDMTISLRARAGALVFGMPAMFFAARAYGPTGCAVTWILIYTGYLLFIPPRVFRGWRSREMTRWYLEDVLMPMVAAFGLAYALSRLPQVGGRAEVFARVGACGLAVFAATAAALPATRRFVLAAVKARD